MSDRNDGSSGRVKRSHRNLVAATTKAPAPTATAKDHLQTREPRKVVHCPPGANDAETERNFASLITSPDMAASRVINGAEAKSGLGELIDVPHLMANLRDHAAAVNRGDMAHAEAMLINQAMALQTLFARLAERGLSQDGAVPFELNMRMALRAQSQCRATLETLAAIKNPPVVIARQANVTTGPQQVVNNGSAAPSHARENEIKPSKLLGAEHGERLDSRAAAAAGGANQTMAALGAIDRPQDFGGEGESGA